MQLVFLYYLDPYHIQRTFTTTFRGKMKRHPHIVETLVISQLYNLNIYSFLYLCSATVVHCHIICYCRTTTGIFRCKRITKKKSSNLGEGKGSEYNNNWPKEEDGKYRTRCINLSDQISFGNGKKRKAIYMPSKSSPIVGDSEHAQFLVQLFSWMLLLSLFPTCMLFFRKRKKIPQ